MPSYFDVTYYDIKKHLIEKFAGSLKIEKKVEDTLTS